MFLKISPFHKKKPALEYLFNKVGDLNIGAFLWEIFTNTFFYLLLLSLLAAFGGLQWWEVLAMTSVGATLQVFFATLLKLPLAWMFSCKFVAYFQNSFSYKPLWIATSASVDNNLNMILSARQFTKTVHHLHHQQQQKTKHGWTNLHDRKFIEKIIFSPQRSIFKILFSIVCIIREDAEA